MTTIEQDLIDPEIDDSTAHTLDCVCDDCIDDELLARAEDRAA